MPSPLPLGDAEHVLADLDRFRHRTGRDLGEQVRQELPGLRGSFGRLLDTIPDEGANQRTLADGMWITKQSLGERLRSLEELGWISIEPDPTDRRARIVRRTPRGDEIRAFLRSRIAAVEDAWAAEVGADRYRTFREVLAELGRVIPPEPDAGA